MSTMHERKSKVYDLCEGLYSIMCDAVKPRDKERWKETVWNNVKDISPQAFDSWAEITRSIIEDDFDDAAL